MRVCISLFLCEYDFSIHASMFFHGSCEYGISSAMRVLVTYKAMRVLTDIYSMRVLNWVQYASIPYLVHASMLCLMSCEYGYIVSCEYQLSSAMRVLLISSAMRVCYHVLTMRVYYVKFLCEFLIYVLACEYGYAYNVTCAV